MVGNSLSFAMTLSLLTGAGYWIAMPLWMRFLSESNVSRSMLALAFLIAPLSLLEMYLSGILLGLERIAQLSIVSIVRFSSLLVLNVVLVLVLKLGVLGALCAAVSTIGICVAMCSFFLKSDARIRPGLDRGALEDALAFGVQAHLGTILYFLNLRLGVFIVNFLAGATEVGLYAVATSLVELLWFLPNAFGFVLFPKTASSDPETAKRFTPRVARLSLVITALAAAGLFLVSKPLITLFYTDEFLPALHPLWILLPGAITVSYSQIFFNDLGGRGKPIYGTFASLASLLMTLGGGILLIPRFGITGAAVALSLSYITNAAVAIYAYIRISGNRLTDVLLIQKGDTEAILSIGYETLMAIRQSLCAWGRSSADLSPLVRKTLTERQPGERQR
jgi:O-antigen/teichoic acid export membrane protein